ncbi:hypothetical protein [Sphingobacterium sp. LRF_L2]|uniref:hypothetical protein n=1 Tax=Sphingobacterium sp. LRF_L2 TaxID=3369421 RepID=UPI003F5F0AAE
MERIDDITIQHPLRTILLRVNTTVTAPAYEKEALACYEELHDKTHQLQQEVKNARTTASDFVFQLEEIDEFYRQARDKFKHLEVMLPTNPDKPIVTIQLQTALQRIEEALNEFVPDLADSAMAFYAYDDRTAEFETWMNEVAFAKFDHVFANYKECAVELVAFDRDLDDFKGSLSFFKRQEEEYYKTMNIYIEQYTDLNLDIDKLFKQVENFDPKLLP